MIGDRDGGSDNDRCGGGGGGGGSGGVVGLTMTVCSFGLLNECSCAMCRCELLVFAFSSCRGCRARWRRRRAALELTTEFLSACPVVERWSWSLISLSSASDGSRLSKVCTNSVVPSQAIRRSRGERWGHGRVH